MSKLRVVLPKRLLTYRKTHYLSTYINETGIFLAIHPTHKIHTMKTISTLLLTLTTVFTLAQPAPITEKVKFDWGPEIKLDKRGQFLDVVSFDESGYYMLKSAKKGLHIDKYNNDLSLSNSLLLDMEKDGKDMRYEGLAYFNESLVLFTSYSDSKVKTNYLYYQQIDRKNLQQNGTVHEVAQIPFEKRRRDGSFGYDISPDSSKLLIYAGMPYEKDGPEKFGFSVHNEKMEKIWQKDIELPYMEQLFRIEEYDISNKGNVFITGVEFREKQEAKKRKGEPNHRYHILGYFDKGAKVKDYVIDLGDKFITDLTATVRENDDIICTGFYSENGTWSIAGTFFLTIDGESKEIKTKSFKKFDEDFIVEGMTEREEEKAKKKAAKKDRNLEMYNYEFRELIQREDGGAILIAEQYRFYQTCHTTTDANGNTTTRCTNHYVYGDIILININPSGQIVWASKVDKYQHSTNDGGYFSSFFSHVVDDKIYLIYGETAKSFYDRQDKLEQWKQLGKEDKRAMLTLLVEVNSKGETERELLFNNRIEGFSTRPKVCEQINPSQSIIYTRARKYQKFTRLTF